MKNIANLQVEERGLDVEIAAFHEGQHAVGAPREADGHLEDLRRLGEHRRQTAVGTRVEEHGPSLHS
jgi:hypothetical protein